METREFECLQGLMDGFRNHLRLTTTDMDGILMENLRAAILVCEHEISTVIPVSSFKKRISYSINNLSFFLHLFLYRRQSTS